MLHDIKSRFFGNGLGYLAMMLWPIIHIVVIIAVYAASGRIAPSGNSVLLFAAAGVMPFVYISYISRFMILGVMMNRPFLQYPIIKLMDLMTARAILEVINMCLVTFVIFVGLSLTGVDGTPINPVQAFEALVASMLLGLGLGYLNGIIVMVLPMWNLVHVLFTIIAYAAGGILFIPGALPLQAQYYLSFNPVLQGVVWMRSAFYHDFDQHILDKAYLWEWGFGSLAAGIIGERILRSILVSSR